jgi:hypothetical protein
VVPVYDGDPPPAGTAPKKALAGAADPNRPVQVLQALPVPILLALSIRLDPRFVPGSVIAGVTAGLNDPDNGLFGLNRVRIGQTVFNSEIYEACLNVPGVLAVHGLQFYLLDSTGAVIFQLGAKHFPGEGSFYQLLPSNLIVTPEATPNA